MVQVDLEVEHFTSTLRPFLTPGAGVWASFRPRAGDQSVACSHANSAHPVFVNEALSEDSRSHTMYLHTVQAALAVQWQMGFEKPRNAHLWPLTGKICQLLFRVRYKTGSGCMKIVTLKRDWGCGGWASSPAISLCCFQERIIT